MYKIEITGIAGWTTGQREESFNDGVEAAARILAGKGIDTRGLLDLSEGAKAAVGRLLRGEPAEDPRLDTPEGRLEMLREAMINGTVEVAPPERGGFVIQWSAEGLGFGEYTVRMNDDGIDINDECMSKAFGRALFEALLKHRKESM